MDQTFVDELPPVRVPPQTPAPKKKRPPRRKASAPRVRPYAHTVANAALLLDISYSAVYAEVRRGRLRCVMRGRTLLILDADLLDYLSRLPEHAVAVK
jgi:excisionase family DNA binding protein